MGDTDEDGSGNANYVSTRSSIHVILEDKSDMRNPPHPLQAGLRLTVRLTRFCSLMLHIHYIHTTYIP